MKLNVICTAMRNLFSIYYFLCCFFFLSCGKSVTNEKENPLIEVSVDSTDRQPDTNKKVILFFGTSLTAGMGVDLTDAYPAVIQRKIDSLGLMFTVVNGGLSGDTTASGKNRIAWALRQNIDVFVLELGANDGLRGIPLGETYTNLQVIIDLVRQKNPETKIILAGMQIPPNMGQDYTKEFSEIFPKLAAQNKVALVPFLLQDVGGVEALNQQDGIHPTAEGQEIVAQNMWEVLQPILLD